MLPISLLAVLNVACASERPVPSADVAPVVAAVVAAVDSAVGVKDSLPIDPRILLRRTMWRRKPVATAWSESQLAATISPRHPRLELGMLAFVCLVRAPGCAATRERAVLALSEPVLHRDTVLVETAYAARRRDDSINELHWLWFAIRKGGSWRVVKRTTLDRS